MELMVELEQRQTRIDLVEVQEVKMLEMRLNEKRR
jgi:hypothetical protein